jgi:hypothetical protein
MPVDERSYPFSQLAHTIVPIGHPTIIGENFLEAMAKGMNIPLNKTPGHHGQIRTINFQYESRRKNGDETAVDTLSHDKHVVMFEKFSDIHDLVVDTVAKLKITDLSSCGVIILRRYAGRNGKEAAKQVANKIHESLPGIYIAIF